LIDLLRKNKIFQIFQKTIQRSYSSNHKSKFIQIYDTAAEATHDIKDGSSILIGGFGLCGLPEKLIHAVNKSSVKDLVVISNTGGTEDFGPVCTFKRLFSHNGYINFILVL
jgi:hypothetical protein